MTRPCLAPSTGEFEDDQENHEQQGPDAALMYSTPDGSKTMTASITMGDAAIDQAQVFPAELKKLVNVVFCGK